MDEQLEKVLGNLVSQSGVVGVVVADSNGLCLSTKGNNAPSEVAGFLASIATRAKELAPKDLDEIPLVLIETEANNIFIRNQDEMTIGIYKIP